MRKISNRSFSGEWLIVNVGFKASQEDSKTDILSIYGFQAASWCSASSCRSPLAACSTRRPSSSSPSATPFYSFLWPPGFLTCDQFIITFSSLCCKYVCLSVFLSVCLSFSLSLSLFLSRETSYSFFSFRTCWRATDSQLFSPVFFVSIFPLFVFLFLSLSYMLTSPFLLLLLLLHLSHKHTIRILIILVR